MDKPNSIYGAASKAVLLGLLFAFLGTFIGVSHIYSLLVGADGLSDSMRWQLTYACLVTLLLTTLGCGLGLAICGYLQNHWIFRRLRQLTSDMRKLSKGQFDQQPLKQGGDEIGQIANFAAVAQERFHKTLSELEKVLQEAIDTQSDLSGATEKVTHKMNEQRMDHQILENGLLKINQQVMQATELKDALTGLSKHNLQQLAKTQDALLDINQQSSTLGEQHQGLAEHVTDVVELSSDIGKEVTLIKHAIENLHLMQLNDAIIRTQLDNMPEFSLQQFEQNIEQAMLALGNLQTRYKKLNRQSTLAKQVFAEGHLSLHELNTKHELQQQQLSAIANTIDKEQMNQQALTDVFDKQLHELQLLIEQLKVVNVNAAISKDIDSLTDTASLVLSKLAEQLGQFKRVMFR